MKKILVIDDDTDTLDVVELVLSHHNFIVKTTYQWQIILDTINTFTPDLILLDVNLGGINGCEICKTLKQSKETRQVPVILFSVHLMTEHNFKACDAQGFLAKPLEAANLLEVIRLNLN